MRTIAQGVLAVVLSVMGSSVWAFSLERYVEGVHYEKVAGAERKPDTVMEFFSFGCPHCNHLEPLVEKWLKTKPEAMQFTRVPAAWNPRFKVLAKLYYVIVALGIEDKAVPAVFDYLHKQNQVIDGRASAWAALSGLEVKEADFAKAWEDEQVETKANTAGRIYGQYQIRGVPAMVVNGQYKTSVKMAGSQNELFEVINFLLTK